MKLALLSNVTIEVLAGMLKKEHSLWLPSGFGAWLETALDPPQEMLEFNPEVIFLLLDSSHSVCDPASVQKAKTALESVFPNATVLVPDLEDLSDETGEFYDEGMWRIGAMPWSIKGLRAIRDEINRLLSSMTSVRKKVLAIDFDNTLWHGVIGEDGIDGVVPYSEFQQRIKDLRKRGVLLVGLSKNNILDVTPIWNDPRMVLGCDDFAAMCIDWDAKATNIVKVAGELNLGLDSFVFVDDNPAEREQMKALHPEVVVPEFPDDEEDLPRFARRIARLYFPEMRLTDEDRRKTEQYREEAARREFATGLSIGDYLKGLEIWVDVHQIVETEIPRVAQLSQKTNQFNVLTNRYTVNEVRQFAEDETRLIITVRSGDRFGDQGIVAFVHAIIDDNDATIVDWVMSCRTMNRRIEFAVEDRLEDILSKRGVTMVHATWRRTLKNEPVAALFDAFGFERIESNPESRQYRLVLPRQERLEYYVAFRNSSATVEKEEDK